MLPNIEYKNLNDHQITNIFQPIFTFNSTDNTFTRAKQFQTEKLPFPSKNIIQIL